MLGNFPRLAKDSGHGSAILARVTQGRRTVCATLRITADSRVTGEVRVGANRAPSELGVHIANGRGGSAQRRAR